MIEDKEIELSMVASDRGTRLFERFLIFLDTVSTNPMSWATAPLPYPASYDFKLRIANISLYALRRESVLFFENVVSKSITYLFIVSSSFLIRNFLTPEMGNCLANFRRGVSLYPVPIWASYAFLDRINITANPFVLLKDDVNLCFIFMNKRGFCAHNFAAYDCLIDARSLFHLAVS